jgi:hypothetical protein
MLVQKMFQYFVKCWQKLLEMLRKGVGRSEKMLSTKMLVPKMLEHFVKCWEKLLEMLKKKLLKHFNLIVMKCAGKIKNII